MYGAACRTGEELARVAYHMIFQLCILAPTCSDGWVQGLVGLRESAEISHFIKRSTLTSLPTPVP